MANDMAHARAKRKCPECGREVSGNNYGRHLATHGVASNGSKPKRSKSAKLTGRAATVAVGAYLDYVAEGGQYGAGRVSLGAMPGFPTYTADPDVIDAAAAEYERRADDASTRIVELKRRNRALALRAAAEDLRAVDSGEDVETRFTACAAAWAESNGITYEAFREMGVPARVLKAAGVAR